MNNPNQQPSSFIVLQIIHGGLCLSPLLFLIVTSSINKNQAHSDIRPNDVPLIYAALIAALVSPVAGNYIFRKKLLEIDANSAVAEKFKAYLTICIIRYALLEAAALFNIVTAFLTGNLIASVASVILLLYMVMIRPVKTKVINELNISYPDTL